MLKDFFLIEIFLNQKSKQDHLEINQFHVNILFILMKLLMNMSSLLFIIDIIYSEKRIKMYFILNK